MQDIPMGAKHGRDEKREKEKETDNARGHWRSQWHLAADQEPEPVWGETWNPLGQVRPGGGGGSLQAGSSKGCASALSTSTPGPPV